MTRSLKREFSRRLKSVGLSFEVEWAKLEETFATVYFPTTAERDRVFKNTLIDIHNIYAYGKPTLKSRFIKLLKHILP